MNTTPKTWQKSLLTLITGLSLLLNTNAVQSQIIPDNTLGSENSKFTPGQVKDLIEGGAIRGNNLFHSFSEFNVNNNQQVYFTNPTGINNILTRVTGNNISNIFGTLGVNGNANLFLINPNGIIFGQNARLDVKGSFLASTANAIKFSDNTLFSAKDTSPNPLLTMSVPVGIQWGNNPTGDITNNGNLTTGKDLTLSGKNITSNGILSTPYGKIELTAITGDVQVQQLNAVAATLTANGNINYGNISMENENPAVTNLNPTLSLIAEKQITGTGNITTTAPGLLVNLQAKNDINIKDINTKGGDINITSEQGNITTGLLNTAPDTYQTTTIDVDPDGNVEISAFGQQYCIDDLCYDYISATYNGDFTFSSSLTNPISEVKLRLSASDVVNSNVSLSSPTGLVVNLIDATGNNNFQDTLLADSSSTPISSVSTPFNGTFKPSESLAKLNEINPNGTWYLKIYSSNYDLNANTTVYQAGESAPWGIATGTQLIITTTNPNAGGNVNLNAGGMISTGDINSSSNFNPGLITLKANHNITTGHINASSILGNGGAITTPKLLVNLQAKNDINIKDINTKGGDINITSEQGNITTGLLNTAPDNTDQITTIDVDPGGQFVLEEGGACTGVSQNCASLRYKGDFTFSSSLTNPISEVKLRLSASDVVNSNVSLFSPAGGGLYLMYAAGNNNFQDTLFADSSPTPISSASTPFNGTFKPSGSLATLNDINPNGTWYLKIDNPNYDNNANTIVYKAGDSAPWGIATGTQLIITTTNPNAGGNVNLNAGGMISTGDINSSSNFNPGLITLQANYNITTGHINASSMLGNGGAIALTTTAGNITTQSLNSSSFSNSGNAGNGGAIILRIGDTNALTTTAGNITTQSLNSSSSSNSGNTGNGGAISLNTTQGAITTQSLNSFSSSVYGSTGNGGAIALNTKAGNITTQSLNSSSRKTGNGGAISLTTTGGDILTQSLDSSSFYGNGEGGDIFLTTSNGNITTGYLNSSSFDGHGQGGDIFLTTSNGNILTQSLNSSSSYSMGNGGGDIFLTTSNGNILTQSLNSSSYGNGGDIFLRTSNSNITTESLNSSSFNGNGGDIFLRTSNSNITTGYLNSYSSGNGRNGGAIDLMTTGGNIFWLGNIINSSATGEGGNAGNLSITGEKLMLEGNLINSNGNNGSNGGTIQFNASFIELIDSDINSSSLGTGNAGQIFLNSTGDINFNNSRLLTTLEPGSTGKGGNIQIQTQQNLNLSNFSVINTGTYSIGNAGDIKINAQNLSLIDGSNLQSLTTDKGNAGHIFLNVLNGNIFLNNSSSISTSATNTASGNSGNIQLNSRTLSILNGSQIQALTEGIETSKAGEIIVNASDSIIIGGVDPNFANYDINALPSLNIVRSDHEEGPIYTDYCPDACYINITGYLNNNQIKDIGSNNSIITAQQITASDFYLNNPNKNNPNVEYNSRIPYTSIDAVGDDKIHVYAIKVNAGTRAVFDIDNTADNYFVSRSTPAVNTKLTLLNSQGQVLAYNDDAPHGLGGGGSDPSMTLQQDPYMRYTFTQGGTYYLQVSNFDGQGVPNFLDSVRSTRSYDLQISLETNPIKANLTNNGQPSGIFAYTTGAGTAGNILLNTNDLKLESGGSISAFTNGSGTGGTININANNSINLGVGVQNFAPVVSVETSNAGKAGDIIINTPNFTLSETARITATATKNATNTEQGGSITLNANKMNLAGIVGIFAETQGAAPAGTLKLNPYNNQNTLDLTLFPGSIISASTSGSGNGGDFQITANDTINISGKGKLAVETTGKGNAGNILFSTQNLNIKEAEISANTTGEGKAGSINFNVNNINIEQDAKISATTSGGEGGSININNAQKLNLNSGGQLLTTTSGNNAAGDINIQVKESINLNGKNTGFFANTAPNSTGNGGNIKIDPITMIIENGAAIAVNSDGSGVGGNIFLQAGNLVLNNGNINAETVNSNGGGITLEIGNYLLLANNSKITSTAGTLQSGGNGGNVQINAPFIIGLSTNPNHQIIANAFTGKGGNIDITTNGIFGIQYIDIQASSQFGVNGTITINTPGIDPTSGLTKLPSVPTDISGLINKSCGALFSLSNTNSFTVTGKGGITPSPTDPLTPDKIWQDLEILPGNITQKSPLISENNLPKEKTNQPKEIMEAQGFIKDDKGNIILTSQPLQVTANGVYLHPLDCERLLK